MRYTLFAGFVLLFTPGIHAQALPWVFPGDFRERIRISDLVISGAIETAAVGIQSVDAVEVRSNLARVRVDRVFKGHCPLALQFKWFKLWSAAGKGTLYSGPPIADFRAHERYLIFLKQGEQGWVVAMPVYALEMKLAAASPPNAISDLSAAPVQARYRAIAEELEVAALSVPNPSPGMTGEAASYFSPVFDLLGGCGEAFYHHFESSPSSDLQEAAFRWLSLIKKRHLSCTVSPSSPMP